MSDISCSELKDCEKDWIPSQAGGRKMKVDITNRIVNIAVSGAAQKPKAIALG